MRPLAILLVRPFALLLLLAPTVRSETLFVAGEQGVREVALDGKTLRTVSSEKVSNPRRMPDGKSLLYLVPGKPELRRMDLETGASSKVATLPRSFRLCKLPANESETTFKFTDLNIQSAGDFVIDKSGKAACMELMERNFNMADVIINLRVPLLGEL